MGHDSIPFQVLNEHAMDTSTLYNLKPIGLGTAYSESLTSYLIRLSESHCISVGTLFNKFVSKKLNKPYVNRSVKCGGNRFFDGAKALNGVDKNSNDLINALEDLTYRNDLIYLTLQVWGNVFTNRELLKEYLSWCPYCLKEFENRHKICYMPLQWYLKPVKYCVVHQTALVDNCFNCNKKLPILHRSSNNNSCPYCKAKLTNIPFGFKEKIENIDREKYYSKNIADLIAITNTISNKLYRDIIKTRINKLEVQYTDINQISIRKELEIPKSTFYSWQKGLSLPTIRNILEICYSLGLSLQDFLFKENLIIQPILKSPVVVKIPRRKLDHAKIEKSLQSYLEIAEPLSMVQISKDIQVAKRSLYRIHPQLCKSLSQRYQEYLLLKSDIRTQEIKLLIEQSVNALIFQGSVPTQKKIENILYANCLLRESFAREYLGNYLNSLNNQNKEKEN
ncbi:hypothetical protein AM500_03240 [Bacillus sp. FJAT-18017]|uniref:TniQ family protein n=1 Tax=Bacillus sp. FJAT-18017 TaxID=1705566 RepID=UPI0006AE7022|nr:TniQ family protein [Bacillus sp. FJAT-18017]ALC88923.1 hypothetical protein AM500_03240 [Bacillus sp. FJAT-18017]